MSIHHIALFYDLLQDLSGSLPSDFPFDISKVQSYVCAPDVSVQSFRSVHLVKSFLKKFQGQTSVEADQAALDKFLQSNDQCKSWKLEVEDMADELLVGLFSEEIHRFFEPNPRCALVNHVSDILRNGDTGPGAAVHAHGNDYYTKLYSGRLSATSTGLYTAYEHYIQSVPRKARGEIHRQAEYGFASVVAGNRLVFVPKNVDISRVICVEPSLNMFYQKGLQHIIEGRLRMRYKIDLSTQPDCNKRLAQMGSALDSLCTIDLASASDSISLRMIERFLPRAFSSWLNFARSPGCILPSEEVVPLHMLSSMGNATTFPLQTAIFACIVSAAYRMLDIPMYKGYTPTVKRRNKDGGEVLTTSLPNFGVFGDDIIVEKEAYGQVVRLLSLLGFTVNAEKSFSEGPFRESCGGDYFRGHPVRGVYLKSLKTQADRYVAINRLNAWTAMSGIALPKTVGRILKKTRFIPVPLYENDDAGIKTPYSMLTTVKLDKDIQAVKYRRWASKPKFLRFVDGAVKSPRGTKGRIYNPYGLVDAYLRGDITDQRLSIRMGAQTLYRTEQAVSSNWDWQPADREQSLFGRTRLTSACYSNLNR